MTHCALYTHFLTLKSKTKKTNKTERHELAIIMYGNVTHFRYHAKLQTQRQRLTIMNFCAPKKYSCLFFVFYINKVYKCPTTLFRNFTL